MSHKATFTWGVGPHTVFIAGGFNNWSGDATPLHKQADGSFSGQVEMPYGEKQAFKYVVDGEWKVREDEAKEWDAAGNMNNVYTAPPAPLHEATATSTPVPAPTSVPASTAPDVASPQSSETAPSTLLASSAPAPASSGNPYVLGGVAAGTTTTATPAVHIAATDATSAPTALPTSHVIEKTAATTPIGEAGTSAGDTATVVGETVQSYGAQAAAYGAAALGAIGAVAASAAVVVEKATGVDLTHGQPLSVEEAKAQGIDVEHLPKVDAATDATSPVGTKPPASAVDALEEKVQALKVDAPSAYPSSQAAVPLPNGSAPKSSTDPTILDKIESAPKSTTTDGTDLPAQTEMKDNHKHVPMPVITNLSSKDPVKDRSLDAIENRDTAGTKPVSSDPSVSAKSAKQEAEAHPDSKSGSTQAAVHESKPAFTDPAAATVGVPTATAPTTTTTAPVAVAAVPSSTTTKTSTPITSNPVVPAKDVSAVAPIVPSPATTTAAPPSTPAKTTVGATTAGTPGSLASTPASTPVKKEATNGSDVRKRKSSFFNKIKTAFSSPKDKSK